MTLARRSVVFGSAGLLLPPARAVQAAGLAPTPPQTEGPFYPTALPADVDSDLVQVRGQAARALGTVLHLQGRILDASGRPVDGALIEIWQCDSQGLYDHPRQPGRERRDAAFQGYGRLLVRDDGAYGFRTLKPVAYAGRAPHIHLKVSTADGRRLTSQFYIAGDPDNARDGVFRMAARDPGQRERIEMRLVPAPGVEAGALAATLDVVLA